MVRNNKKLVIALSLLLVLCQWLSLVHATDHLLGIDDDAQCQICTLQQHFQSVTLNAFSGLTAIALEFVPHLAGQQLYLAAVTTSRSIRAPPQHLSV